jgi:lipoprotein-anchoring transpeptidase ErfK/SrfK
MKNNKAKIGAMLLATTMLATPALAQQANVGANADSSTNIQIAQNAHVDVIASLEASGYQILDTKTTLLGRIHIYAQNDVHVREVVISRWTGEVKYDLIVETFADAKAKGTAKVAGETTAPADDEDENNNSGLSVSIGASASSSTEAEAGDDDASASSESSGSVSLGVKLN